MINAAIYISGFLLTYFGVESIRRWSIKKEILDIPNERSSHIYPTPSGGGLVIALVTLVAFLIYQIINGQTFLWSYFIGAVLIAFVSWLDDIFTLSIVWRLLCHILAALLIIFQFGVFDEVYIPILGIINFGLFGFILSILWVVWMTNAFNFMDGIDGIAGVQALTASIGWGFAGWIWGIEIYVYFAAILFVTNLAFLIHNWHPAKIFMGDVGSAFLGFTFAVFPLFSKFENNPQTMNPYILLIAVMFVWLFVFDTVITLIRRLLKKERIWKAHRSHLYQLLVIRNIKHSTVSKLYGLFSSVIVFGVIYCLILNKYELVFICLTLMVSATLVLLVYNKNLLTNE